MLSAIQAAHGGVRAQPNLSCQCARARARAAPVSKPAPTPAPAPALVVVAAAWCHRWCLSHARARVRARRRSQGRRFATVSVGAGDTACALRPGVLGRACGSLREWRTWRGNLGAGGGASKTYETREAGSGALALPPQHQSTYKPPILNEGKAVRKYFQQTQNKFTKITSCSHSIISVIRTTCAVEPAY